MQNISKKIFGILCSSLLIFFSMANSVTAKALDNGIYTVKCTPYYIHPVTGVVEDSGGAESQGIGQPMTDSATYSTALIEVDSNGNIYATVRLSLMDNIENVSFMVQENGNAPFNDVSYDIMQEDLDNNTTDFRMQIPNENCYLRATFYVVPMGRDVIYYIGFSDFQSGSADFVTSVEFAPPTEEEHIVQEPDEITEPENSIETTMAIAAETTITTTEITTTTTETTASESTVAETTETVTTTVPITEETEIIKENSTIESNVEGIVMFDENGVELKNLSNQPVTENTERKNHVGIAVGVIAGVIVIIGTVSMIFYKRKKDDK